MSFMEYLPPGTGIGAVYALDTQVWDPFLEFTHHLMRGPSPLTVADRELIAAYTSALSECVYCAGAHGSTAAELGYSRELQERLVNDLEVSEISGPMRLLLGFVRKLVLTPTEIVKDDVLELKDAGWSELALNHAIAVASRYVMATRISHAHGIVVEPDKLQEAGLRMAMPDWTCLPPSRR